MPDFYTLEDAETDIAKLIGQVDRLSEVLTVLDSTDPPSVPASGLIHYSLAGHHKYASSDTGTYDGGWTRQRVASPGTPINSVAFTSIPGVFQVTAGKWRVRAMISIVSTFAAGAANLQVNGSAGITDMSIVYWNTAKAANSSVNCTRIQANATVIPSVTFAASEEYIFLDGWVTFSGSGTWAVQMSCTIAADTYTVITDSFVEMAPSAAA